MRSTKSPTVGPSSLKCIGIAVAGWPPQAGRRCGTVFRFGYAAVKWSHRVAVRRSLKMSWLSAEQQIIQVDSRRNAPAHWYASHICWNHF